MADRFGERLASGAIAAGEPAWAEGSPLSVRERSLLVLAALVAQGGADARLRAHVRLALQNGVSADELDAAADRLLDELSRHSPLALAMAKRVLNHAYSGPLPLGLELEGLAYGLLQQTHDFREGVESFVEKRQPEFRGD
jgi:enoyl-CoA hydratase/carnithine racemase